VRQGTCDQAEIERRRAVDMARFEPINRGHLWGVEPEEEVTLTTLLWTFTIALAFLLLVAYVALRWGPAPVRFHAAGR
jgi:hypothetical protein